MGGEHTEIGAAGSAMRQSGDGNSPQCVVALTWVLKDSLGETLDELAEPVEFLVGGDDLLPAIETALQGHAAGARCT
jgi:FKBP-type peptidyl-prolyl cis-trans isomerase 2